MRSVPLIGALAMLLPLSPAFGQGGRPSPGFEVGEPFPDLALPTLAGGDPASLRDFRGRKVILHVFASW